MIFFRIFDIISWGAYRVRANCVTPIYNLFSILEHYDLCCICIMYILYLAKICRASPSLCYMGSVALLWRNIKCNVNPGLSYFERYMVACAGFLANLHLHFTFCQSRQSKATLAWFWVTRFWIVPVLYRWIIHTACSSLLLWYLILLHIFIEFFSALLHCFHVLSQWCVQSDRVERE